MKKSTLNISILLLAWIAFVSPAIMHAVTVGPVKLESNIIEAFIRAIPKSSPDEIRKTITDKMDDLWDRHKRRFDDESSLPSTALLTCAPLPKAKNSTLKKLLFSFKKTPRLPKLHLHELEEFCEGYNDGIRYIDGEYSAQQIILDYRKDNPPNGDNTTFKRLVPYFCGVNEAMVQRSHGKFPWAEKKLYAKPAKKIKVQKNK